MGPSLTVMPRFAYRQIHEQTSAAAATLVVLAEFGVRTLDPALRGQELTLHGLWQRGVFQAHRGTLLLHALKHLTGAGLRCEIRHDVQRAQAMSQVLQVAEDLNATSHRPVHTITDFGDEARVLLLEALPARASLALHVLLARREAESYYVMNPETGQDTTYSRWQLDAHLNSPVLMGPTTVAGRLYTYTGIAARIWR
jgi:hypothetical protein